MRPIFYDTETTGLKRGEDRIIEIAAYDLERDTSFVTLVNPEMTIPDESIQICNITNEMVQDAATFNDVGKRFVEFCDGDVVLVAHNNDNFDKPFLDAEFKRSNIEMPKWLFLDSLKWARKYRK